MRIRTIQEKDNLQVADLIRTCLTEYGGDHRPDTAWADPFIEYFSDVYVLENNAYWVAVDDNDKVIAGVGIGPVECSDEVCELQKIYCYKEYRGTGIGQRLMDTALEFAKKYYKSCYLETMPNMERARKFYEKNGFKQTELTFGNTGHTGCACHYIKEL